MLLRWLHVVAGIAWIGSSFYFVWLDDHLEPPSASEPTDGGIAGELWAVHGGGFYRSQKYRVAPRALHRIVAISSGTLDSLPANGYLVMLIRSICGETHARAYAPIFVTTVMIPAAGTAIAIVLFKLVPQWATM